MKNLYNIDLSVVEIEYFKNELEKYIKFILSLDIKIIGVLLFGSVATGKARNDDYYLSDIDLIIVCNELPDNRNERKKKIFNLVKSIRSNIQDIWITSKELENYVDSKFYLILDAFEEGKILYDPCKILINLKNKLLNDLKKKGVIKTDFYWQWPLKKFGDKIDY